MSPHPSIAILEALNRYLSIGLSLREAMRLTDSALGLRDGTARLVLKGGAL